MLQVLAVLCGAVGGASEFAPNFRKDSADHTSRLRGDILSRPNVDRLVPPTSVRTTGYSDTGTDVGMQIRLFKVKDVVAAEGVMRLKVWVRMAWMDTRLAWNESEYGGVSSVFFQGETYAGAETGEIWVPDITPYNGMTGFALSTEPTVITVSSSGSVYYSRPAILETMCKFSGLVAFPFDSLKCTIEFGGWMTSGGYQGIYAMNGGFELGSQEVTTGTAYQEFSISGANVTEALYTYPCCPSEPWPALIFKVQLKRSGMYYIFIVIIPGVVITLLSFAVFFTDTASADALGYGITVIVVNLLSTVVLVSMLPVCGELIWVDIFTTTNTIFCFISLMQSALNVMLERTETQHLVPQWVVYIGVRIARHLGKMVAICFPKAVVRNSGALRGLVEYAHDQDSEEADEASGDPFRVLSSAKSFNESVAGLIYRQQRGSAEAMVVDAPKVNADDGTFNPMAGAAALSNEELAVKLTYFEKLFFEVDSLDASGFIGREECESLLSYGRLELGPDGRQHVFGKYDYNGNGELNRVEFVELCFEQLLWVPFDRLDRAVQNLKNAAEAPTRRNAAYWTRVADRSDKFSRIFIPTLYGLALCIVFNLELSDDYEQAGVQMFEGFGRVEVAEGGAAIIITYCAFVLFSVIATMVVKHLGQQEEAKSQAIFKAAVIQTAAKLTRAKTGVGGAAPAPAPARAKDTNNVTPFSPKGGTKIAPSGEKYAPAPASAPAPAASE